MTNDSTMKQDDLEVTAQQEVEEYQSMEELLRDDTRLNNFKNGAIVTGVVENISDTGVLVNIGAKSEGIIPQDEIDKHEKLAIGETIYVYVTDNGSRSGNIMLSKKKADYEKAWRDIMDAYENNKTLTVMVSERVNGGLVVNLGIRGFLPASHVATRNINALSRFVGQAIPIKIVEIDRHKKRVVVSHKQAIDEEKKVRRDATVATLEEGQIRRGIVRRVTEYGAFIDLGGIDGLLHVTEMSWGRINHPSDVVKAGQKIDIVVLKYDPETDKISLGLKQILPDPWQHIDELFSVNEEVEGVITRLVPFGAFVAFDNGIEGIIPTAELSDEKIGKPADVVSVKQRVHVKIINIRAQERRMTLSLRQVVRNEEDSDVSTYMNQTVEAEGMATIGSLLSDVFANNDDDQEVAEEVTEAAEEIVEEPVAEEVAEVEAVVEETTEEVTEETEA